MKHIVSELKLKNRSRGLLVHIPDATVMTFEINFRAGEYLVSPEKWETPHLMEHLLLGANKKIPKARDFHAEFEKNGAYNNASTNVYEVSYEAECADFEWDRILDLLILAITQPLFLEEDFKAEFGNVREEMTYRSNNHFRQLSLALREKYGLLAKTDKERLKLMSNVSLKDIVRHYKRTHTASNLRFVIAGNLTPSRLEAIEQIFAEIDLPRGTGRSPLPDEQPKTLAEPLYIRNRTVDNLYFYVDTFLLRRLNDDETDALNLINTMLTETLYSKILGKARERGLIYDMSSGWGQTKLASNWWFGAQVLPANAPHLFAITIEELSKVFNGELDPDDISAAQQYAIGRFQRGAQTVGGTAAGYSNRYFFDDVIEDYYKVPKRIKAVTKESIIDVARNMFKDNIWGVGFLGSCGVDLAREFQTQLMTLWDQPKK
ncbi:MAG TPA: pitrilysin family protein [Candidatus Binatia bacterium]|nr:pitrilysin family protein [Candidatus Binatia bacterium]